MCHFVDKFTVDPSRGDGSQKPRGHGIDANSADEQVVRRSGPMKEIESHLLEGFFRYVSEVIPNKGTEGFLLHVYWKILESASLIEHQVIKNVPFNIQVNNSNEGVLICSSLAVMSLTACTGSSKFSES